MNKRKTIFTVIVYLVPIMLCIGFFFALRGVTLTTKYPENDPDPNVYDENDVIVYERAYYLSNIVSFIDDFERSYGSKLNFNFSLTEILDKRIDETIDVPWLRSFLRFFSSFFAVFDFLIQAVNAIIKVLFFILYLFRYLLDTTAHLSTATIT